MVIILLSFLKPSDVLVLGEIAGVECVLLARYVFLSGHHTARCAASRNAIFFPFFLMMVIHPDFQDLKI